MSPMMLRFFTLVGAALAAASIQMKARATPLDGVELRQQAQALIVAQLKAFQADDADAAFAVASPKLRERIGNAPRYLDIVRGTYPMVYRPAAFGFLPLREEQGQVLQLVSIRDEKERSWLALFTLERQADGSLRISGCMVAENTWRSAGRAAPTPHPASA